MMYPYSPGPAWMTWRGLQLEDYQALEALDLACKQVDGAEPVSNLPADAMQAVRVHADNTFCAENDGQIMAAGWVMALSSGADEQRLQLGGCVHPQYRRRGLGSLPLEWLESRAARLGGVSRVRRLIIRNEALTADAHSIYSRAGFGQVFAEHMMVRALEGDLPYVSLPDNVCLLPWSTETAGLYYQAYRDSFVDRPGRIEAAEEWIGGYEADADFRRDLSRVALLGKKPVAFVTTGDLGGFAWLSQTGVVPDMRGRGIAYAMLVEVLRSFQAEGYREAGLHVNVNNPAAGRRFYELGFRRRLTRARYEKTDS